MNNESLNIHGQKLTFRWHKTRSSLLGFWDRLLQTFWVIFGHLNARIIDGTLTMYLSASPSYSLYSHNFSATKLRRFCVVCARFMAVRNSPFGCVCEGDLAAYCFAGKIDRTTQQTYFDFHHYQRQKASTS